MERTSATFWCYNCEKQFEGRKETEACVLCSSSAIELVDSQAQGNQPSSFQVYQIPSSTPPTNNITQPQSTQHNHSIPVITHTTFQFGFPQFQAFNIPFMPLNANIFSIAENLLSPNGGIMSLIESLSGQRGLTPATNMEINNLQKVDRVAQCSICQQEDANVTNVSQKRGLKLKCGHMFHLHCIGPWFERTNTCPSCRVRI